LLPNTNFLVTDRFTKLSTDLTGLAVRQKNTKMAKPQQEKPGFIKTNNNERFTLGRSNWLQKVT